MVTEKIRLTNAADAAAYSAGVIQARALNYDAYANRAIIANQIAIAQTISLVSWMNYAVDVFCNLGGLANAVGGTGPMANDMQRWTALAALTVGDAVATYYSGGEACEIAQTAAEYVNYGGAVSVTVSNAASVALAGSQELMHAAMSAPMLERSLEAAQRAVDGTGSQLVAEVVPVSYGGATFVRTYAGDDRSRLQGVVLRSRDAFTASREWTLRNAVSLLGRQRIERRGGTTMSNLDTWVASDSMVHRWRVFSRLRWRDRASLVGSGEVAASDDPSSRSSRRSYEFDPVYSGLPAVHDVRDLANPTDPSRNRFGVTVRVRKRLADTLTSQHAALAGPTGRLAVFDAPGAPSEMAALSRAQIVFDRPPRADGRTEYANLYNPYWQVRLAPPTAADRAYAATRQGGVALTP